MHSADEQGWSYLHFLFISKVADVEICYFVWSPQDFFTVPSSFWEPAVHKCSNTIAYCGYHITFWYCSTTYRHDNELLHVHITCKYSNHSIPFCSLNVTCWHYFTMYCCWTLMYLAHCHHMTYYQGPRSIFILGGLIGRLREKHLWK